MEWLSHSNKKYCELCKTPFRFTKLYHSHMPHTLPMAIFLRKACIHTLQYVLAWARGLAVAAVWLVILPWCIRWSWRGLFWLLDARWARDAWLSKMEALALQAASEKETQGAALADILSTASSEQSAPSGEPIALNLSKFILGALLNPWRPLNSPHGPPNTNMTSHARISAQSTLLSDVQAVNSLTLSPWMNRFILDVMEGQIVTFLVVIAFILVFLIREWVVQQQPIINAAANAREDELHIEAAEQALQRRRRRRNQPNPAPQVVAAQEDDQDAEGNNNRDAEENNNRDAEENNRDAEENNRDAEENNRGEETDAPQENREKTFIGWDAMAMLFFNAGVPYDREESYMREVGVILFKTSQQIQLAMDAGATSDEVQENIQLILAELPNEEGEMWINLLNSDERFSVSPLPGSQTSASGPAMDNEQEEEDSDEEALQRPLMPPRGASPTPHQVLRSIQERSDQVEERELDADSGSNASEGSWESLETYPQPPQPEQRSAPGVLGSSSSSANEDLSRIARVSGVLREEESDAERSESGRYNPDEEKKSQNVSTSHEWVSEEQREGNGSGFFPDPDDNHVENAEVSIASGSTHPPGRVTVAHHELDVSPDHPDHAAEVIPQQADLNTTHIPDEAQVAENPKTLLQRLLDWFWADIVPDNTDADPLPAPMEEVIVRDDADEAPFVHVHNDRQAAGQLDPAERDPEVLQAAAEVRQAGIDADAMDEAEDIEGILELIGMQGPLVGLLQTAMFCGVLITTALWAAIGAPYLFGKLALLFLGDPVVFLVMTPIRMVSFTADAIVDGTIYLGAAATYLGVDAFNFLSSWLNGSEVQVLGWLTKRSNSAFDAAGGRLSGVFSTEESLETGFLMVSVHAHQSLRNLQSDIGGIMAIFTRCVFVTNYHLHNSTLASSFYKLTSGFWTGLIEAKQHYGLLKDLVRDAMTNTIKSGSLTVTIPQHDQYMDPSLAYWSATDRCLTVFAGYTFLATIGTMYLLRREPLFTTPSLQRAEKSFTDFLKQAGGVLKVILIISIEMLVFPLYCGMLLDCALLPLFQYASLSSRLAYAARSPCMFAFVHWFIGTCYMFHFALFVSMCRRIMRPGVLYFIRDPDDPTFHPVRDVLERNVTTQLRKIAFSALVYGGLVMFCLGGVVSGIDFVFKGVFPVRWATPEPMLEFPVDFLVYNLLSPVVAKFLLPSEGVETLFGHWLKRCARFLRLSNFLFGEKPPNEDKPKTTEVDDKKDETVSMDGRYVRAPASDQVRIPKGDRVFLEVTNDNERVDGQPDNETGMHGKKNHNFTKVFVPSWFRVRIALFIAGLWLFAAATGVGVTLVPMAFGRKLLAITLPVRVQTNDLYAFSIGLLALGSLLFAVLRGRKAYTTIKDKASSQSVGAVKEATKTQGLRILRSIYVWGFALIIVPSLFALVLQLYLILPLNTYTSTPSSLSNSTFSTTSTNSTLSTLTSTFNKTTIFPTKLQEDSIPPLFAAHTIYVLQDWTLGFLYGRIVLRLLLLSRHSRPATALRLITANGYTNPNAALATRAFILPTLLVFTIILLFPPALASLVYNVTSTLAFKNGQVQNLFRIKVFRYAYPVCAAQGLAVLGTLEVIRAARRWRGRIRDEVYLVGERLHNFGEKKPPLSAKRAIEAQTEG